MKPPLQQLQELAPLAANATDAPWALCSPKFPEAINTADDKQHIALANIGPGIPHMANAAFIAAARNVLTPANIATFQQALEQPAGGWVSVADRLPVEKYAGCDYSARVLAFGDGGIDGPHFVAYCSLDRAAAGQWYLAHDNQPVMTVAHWQLLPATPATAADHA